MAKLPWMKFFPTDYLADTRGLSPSDKGIWMDLICFAWDSPKRGQICADRETFCRMLGCSKEELDHAFVTFMSRGVCQVSENGHAEVTVISRRMSREEKERESARIRKERQRERENVTDQSRKCPPEKPEAICQKPEAIKEKEREYTLFGEFKNVNLMEKEFKKLVEKYGEKDTLETIEEMSSTFKAQPNKYRYKDHYAALQNWIKNHKNRRKPTEW